MLLCHNVTGIHKNVTGVHKNAWKQARCMTPLNPIKGWFCTPHAIIIHVYMFSGFRCTGQSLSRLFINHFVQVREKRILSSYSRTTMPSRKPPIQSMLLPASCSPRQRTWPKAANASLNLSNESPWLWRVWSTRLPQGLTLGGRLFYRHKRSSSKWSR